MARYQHAILYRGIDFRILRICPCQRIDHSPSSSALRHRHYLGIGEHGITRNTRLQNTPFQAGDCGMALLRWTEQPFHSGLRTVWAKTADRKLLQLAFIPACLFVVSEYYADTFLHWTSTLHPKVFDLYLYSFDASLKVQIPFLCGTVVRDMARSSRDGFAFLHSLGNPHCHGLRWPAPAHRRKSDSFISGTPCDGPYRSSLLQYAASLGACASFWKSLSLVTTHCFTSLSYLFGAGSAGRSAQRHSFAAYGVGLADMVVFTRAILVGTLPSLLLPVLYGACHVGYRRDMNLIDLVAAFPFAVFVEALFAFAQPLWSRRRGFALGFGLFTTLGVVCRFALRHTFLLADNSSTVGALHPDGCIVGGC